MSLPESLENVKLAQLPPHIYYISNFISQEEEHELLRQVRHLVTHDTNNSIS